MKTSIIIGRQFTWKHGYLATRGRWEIEAKNKILVEASQKLGEKVQAAQQAEQQASQAQPKEEGRGKNKEKTVDAEVVDAEFEEVKKEDKEANKK